MLRPDVVKQLKLECESRTIAKINDLDSLITASFAYLKREMCDFSIDDIDENYVGKELVLERANMVQ